MPMSNEQYLKAHDIQPGTEAYDEILVRMEHCAENQWWISDDARTRAYYQIVEFDESGRGFMSFEQFQSDLSVLLGRDVWSHEFRSANAEKLRQEAEQAWQAREE